MTTHARATKPISDARADKMAALFWAEYDRWVVRRKTDKQGYELVRDTSPNGDIIDEMFQEIIPLSKRECRDYHDGEAWKNTYANRAAMRAALGAL